MRLVVLASPLEGGNLGFGEHQPVLGALGLQCLQSLTGGLQVVALPDAAHAGGRDGQAATPEFVGHAHLAIGRLLGSERDHGVLDRRLDAVLQDRLALSDLRQGDLATLLVKLLKTIEAVPRVPHDLAGLADVAELLGEFQHTKLGADNLLGLVHRDAPICVLDRCAGASVGSASLRTSIPASPCPTDKTPTVRLNRDFYTL